MGGSLAVLDISGAHAVEITVRRDGKVLWVNTEDGCVLRIYKIKGDVVIKDERNQIPEPGEYFHWPH
jgi:hypothetical protein